MTTFNSDNTIFDIYKFKDIIKYCFDTIQQNEEYHQSLFYDSKDQLSSISSSIEEESEWNDHIEEYKEEEDEEDEETLKKRAYLEWLESDLADIEETVNRKNTEEPIDYFYSDETIEKRRKYEFLWGIESHDNDIDKKEEKEEEEKEVTLEESPFNNIEEYIQDPENDYSYSHSNQQYPTKKARVNGYNRFGRGNYNYNVSRGKPNHNGNQTRKWNNASSYNNEESNRPFYSIPIRHHNPYQNKTRGHQNAYHVNSYISPSPFYSKNLNDQRKHNNYPSKNDNVYTFY